MGQMWGKKWFRSYPDVCTLDADADPDTGIPAYLYTQVCSN